MAAYSATYDAWGNTVSVTDSVPGGMPYRHVGAYACRYDVDTGLTYMRQRWYEAGLQRFVSRDMVRGSNRYIYANNQPEDYMDPSGMQPGAPAKAPDYYTISLSAGACDVPIWWLKWLEYLSGNGQVIVDRNGNVYFAKLLGAGASDPVKKVWHVGFAGSVTAGYVLADPGLTSNPAWLMAWISGRGGGYSAGFGVGGGVMDAYVGDALYNSLEYGLYTPQWGFVYGVAEYKFSIPGAFQAVGIWANSLLNCKKPCDTEQPNQPLTPSKHVWPGNRGRGMYIPPDWPDDFE